MITLAITQEEIRAFHLTGTGLEGCAPAKPLQPALLNAGARATPAGEAPPLLHDLYLHALQEQRAPARRRFAEQVKYCRDRIQEVLALDDSRDPQYSASRSAVSASMGVGGTFFNSDVLATALQTAPSPVPRMAPDRRARCEDIYATLSRALEEAQTAPPYWEFPKADGGAITFCEQQLEKHAATLRAIRVARLEMHAAYDPAVHDAAIARFDWESADTEELMAMPAVLVVDSAERLAEQSLTAFGRLLRSGLPLQILLTCPRFYTGDLAFLAVSHREAFVLQSSLASQPHLAEGLLDMTHTLRPAVAVVATEDAAIFHESRTFPLYVYDPEAGEDWIQRFRLVKNSDSSSPSEWTAAHVAALCPNMLQAFRVLPKEAWSKEQMELAEYLQKYVKQPPLAVPYILVRDAEGNEQRAILTRELVQTARDRRKAWRLLEELSEAGRPAPPPVDTDSFRQEGVRQAYLRVASLLGDSAGLPAPQSPPVLSTQEAPPAPSPGATAPEVPAQQQQAPEEMAPYIDSALCTSCNDCMKINSRMFIYNADKQAYIGDATLGTYGELVKAAEGCPARCIHPGTPRPGDRTATPQVISRAGKFNA